jgi:8-oxo-dGTP pyrophosphatase MutT (NUDIX family)
MSGGPDGSSLRYRCHQTLADWPAPDAEQESLRTRYLEHLGRRPDGWSRACRGSHLTASAIICAPGSGPGGGPGDRQVLLTLHAKIRRWLQTGGHLELTDQSLQDAALREATEESGLDGLELDPVPLVLSRHQVSCGGQPTFHLDVQFLATRSQAAPPVFGAESLDVRWFSTAGLPEVDDSVRALVGAMTARLTGS